MVLNQIKIHLVLRIMEAVLAVITNLNQIVDFFQTLKINYCFKNSVTELDTSNSNNGDITKVKSFKELLKNKTFRQIMTILKV